MERDPGFELERAIASWRAGFTGLAGDELDELVDHLREEFGRLVALGLTADEAWLIATRRLGEKPALEDEFGKVDWHRRVFTFLLGYFGVELCMRLIGAVVTGVLAFGDAFGTLALVAASSASVLGVGFVLFRFLPEFAFWLPERALRSPAWALVLLIATSSALGLVEGLVFDQAFRSPGPIDFSPFMIASGANLAVVVYLVLLTIWVAGRHARRHWQKPQSLWAARVHASPRGD